MGKNKSSDVNVTAILQALTGVPADRFDNWNANKERTTLNKNPAAVALGRLGGLKGGKARMQKLTAKRRSEIAKMAASARWQRS